MSKLNIMDRPGTLLPRIVLLAGLILMGCSGCGTTMDEIKDGINAFILGIYGYGEDEKNPFPANPTSSGTGYPTSVIDAGNSTGNLKPVGFLNTGTVAATVMAWTYIPLNSAIPAVPSNASTVAFPGGNPSSHLSLPLGTYTWCYHWELGDVNNDGMIEYSHAIDTREVTLDESDPDDMDLAEHVGISVPPGTKEFPGVCHLGDQMIRWGNESVEWVVELIGGAVLRGSVQGANYYTWSINSGTFDGENLYFLATTGDAEGCKGSMEAWWKVTTTTVASARILNGCGTESLEVHVFERRE